MTRRFGGVTAAEAAKGARWFGQLMRASPAVAEAQAREAKAARFVALLGPDAPRAREIIEAAQFVATSAAIANLHGHAIPVLSSRLAEVAQRMGSTAGDTPSAQPGS